MLKNQIFEILIIFLIIISCKVDHNNKKESSETLKLERQMVFKPNWKSIKKHYKDPSLV